MHFDKQIPILFSITSCFSIPFQTNTHTVTYSCWDMDRDFSSNMVKTEAKAFVTHFLRYFAQTLCKGYKYLTLLN